MKRNGSNVRKACIGVGVVLILLTLTACSSIKNSVGPSGIKLDPLNIDSISGTSSLTGTVNGVVEVGYTPAASPVLRKFDPSGNSLWNQAITVGSLYPVNPSAVAVDTNENAYVAGLAGVAVDGERFMDAFLQKYQTRCTFPYCFLGALWTRQVGTPANDDLATSVAAYGSSVYLIGFPSFGTSFLRRYDLNGRLLWEKTVPNIRALDVAIDASENAYVVGYAYQPGDSSGDYATLLIAKYRSDGQALWSGEFSAPGCCRNLAAVAVSGDAVYLIGWVGQSRGGDIRVVKLSSSGQILWIRTYGSSGDAARDGAIDASADELGNLYLAGTTYGDFGLSAPDLSANTETGFVAKLDPSGSLRWTQRYPGREMNAVLAYKMTNPCSGLSCIYQPAYVTQVYAGASTAPSLLRLSTSTGATIWSR